MFQLSLSSFLSLCYFLSLFLSWVFFFFWGLFCVSLESVFFFVSSSFLSLFYVSLESLSASKIRFMSVSTENYSCENRT